jgi:thiamine pyrophosphate-dependent acetolactate synthase large subunit-like protein
LDPRRVFIALENLLPDDRVIVTDTGRWIGTLPSLVSARDARSWLIGNSFGVVGLGLGTAIGAAAAHPDRDVVLFCGDGGFMLAAQGLDTVRLNGLRLTIVIMDDELYGSEVKYLDQFGLPRDVVKQGLPDVIALAAAYGGRGVVLRTDADLAGLRFDETALTILDMRVDPEVNVRKVIAAWARADSPARDGVGRGASADPD